MNETPIAPRDDQMLRPAEAARKLGISRSTLYELIDRGLLEEPQPVGVRAVAFRVSTLNAYLERRAAERKAGAEQRAAARAAKRAHRAPSAPSAAT